MKFQIHRLKMDDLIWAQVVEVVGARDLIVSFQGDLVRVSNQTTHSLIAGDSVLVRVAQLEPLVFQIVKDSANRRADRFNISV